MIGIGLIGGSLAIDLKKNGFASHILGVEKDPDHAFQALQLGLVDEVTDLTAAVEAADLVIISIPVDETIRILPTILDMSGRRTTVVDMGSTKGDICRVAGEHVNRKRFVAAHPIAGTENTGPDAAFSGLYTRMKTIICEREKSDSAAAKMVEEMFRSLEMEIIYMDPKDHDRHLAYVSHLSHVSSFLLGLTVLDIEKSEENIFNLAGSGFSSTVRLAMSSPDMWAPIFDQNADHLSNALGAYIDHLTNFKGMLDQGKVKDLHALMRKANKIGKILKGKEGKQDGNHKPGNGKMPAGLGDFAHQKVA